MDFKVCWCIFFSIFHISNFKMPLQYDLTETIKVENIMQLLHGDVITTVHIVLFETRLISSSSICQFITQICLNYNAHVCYSKAIYMYFQRCLQYINNNKLNCQFINNSKELKFNKIGKMFNLCSLKALNRQVTIFMQS